MQIPAQILIVLALVAGTLLPLQAAINGQLKTQLGGPVLAALVSFTVGTLALVGFALVSRTPLPATISGVLWWQWLAGGLMGAIYVTGIILLTPILGVALTFGLVVAGQLAMSLALDHFGWLGLPEHAINLPRLAGAALIVAGVMLIRKY